MEKLSISPKLENVIIEHLISTGVRWEDITRQTGIYPEELQSAHSRIAPETHYRLLTMLHRECGVDWFLSGEGFDIDYLLSKNNVLNAFSEPCDSYAVLCLNSKTLRDALNNYIDYRPIVGNVDRLEFHCEDSGHCEFSYYHYFPELNYSFVTLINFIFIVFIVKNYNIENNIKFHVTCSNSENTMLDHLYQYWNCDVRWDQEKDAITFQVDNLDEDFLHYNKVVDQLIINKVNEEFNKAKDVDNIKNTIEVILKEMINDRDIEFKSSTAIQNICERMHVSKATLGRKLRNSNTTYKFIERKVKLDEAIKMLKDTNISIGDVSYNLGFSSQSAFNRFFSDLMHVTPLKFRKKNIIH